MIIDAHCHAGSGDGFTGPWDTAAALDHYLRRAAAAWVDRTVLFAAFHRDYRAANREVAAIVKRQPGRFYGFAFVNAGRDRGRIGDLVREAVEQHGFRGIKVHRHDARITREICEAARAYKMPVLYDVMGEVAVVELLATEYPDVNFIIPHLGSFADDWRAQMALIDPLVRHPNVYTDTSGVRRFDILAQAARRAGARKILYGSYGPWLHPGLELAKVKAAKPEAKVKPESKAKPAKGKRKVAEVSKAGRAPEPQKSLKSPAAPKTVAAPRCRSAVGPGQPRLA
jgi:hypothetical protein